MIERYLLRYFLAVVNAGSFSKAAARVHVTQPTLSVGIAKLETLVGAPIFHRTSQRVHLTEAGARLLTHARRIENEFNVLARSAIGAGETRLVRLGVLSTIPTASLERLVAEHRQRDDGGQIEIVEGGERDLVVRLGRGRIDLALTTLREDGEWRQEPLYQEHYSLALPRWHRFAPADTVRAEDLAEETMIVRRHCEALSKISRHFTERGVRPRFSFRTTNDDKALSLVRAGLGITVMPDGYRDPDVARPRLAGFELTRRIGIVHGNGSGLSGEEAPLLDAIRAVMGSSRKGGGVVIS
ncbi:LysR family transcriptional regulator [Novosphingobium sp. PY1]|uniref:LysR family transcriptional regulator n=1 Tax=Novosphingobium sp. PY1 TaxID=1882221 RepID=UPI000BE778F2|nr:LysR family transcriptional regulator [Novosphingobium sp. PY1]BBA74028.1 LysR family transcriptional regulator [Novosphingobium sp. PY1]GFM31265.1 LysR family transcriptional regulator [Novosphingobium sp. PY1]